MKNTIYPFFRELSTVIKFGKGIYKMLLPETTNIFAISLFIVEFFNFHLNSLHFITKPESL